jgi:hypothetical protein
MSHIRNRIDFWFKLFPDLKFYFQNQSPSRGLISMATIFESIENLPMGQCYNFVDGLVLLQKHLVLKEEDKEGLVDILVSPVMSKMIDYLKSDSYLRPLVYRNVLGNEKLLIAIPEITITPGDIFRYIKNNNIHVLVSSDLDMVKVCYAEYKFKAYGIGRDSSIFSDAEEILHPGIFNRLGFKIFMKCLTKVVPNCRSTSADIAFFYHMLRADDFINCKPVKFQTWYHKNTSTNGFPYLGRIHKLERYTRNKNGSEENREFRRRIRFYNESKKSIKSK